MALGSRLRKFVFTEKDLVFSPIVLLCVLGGLPHPVLVSSAQVRSVCPRYVDVFVSQLL